MFKNAIFLFFFLADFKSVHPSFSTQHRHWRSCEGSPHAVLAAMLGQTVMFTKLLSLRQNDSTHLSSWQLRSGSCRYLLFSLVTNKKKNNPKPKNCTVVCSKVCQRCKCLVVFKCSFLLLSYFLPLLLPPHPICLVQLVETLPCV